MDEVNPKFGWQFEEDTLSLAGAIAERTAIDDIVTAQICAEVRGEPFDARPVHEIIASKVGRSSLLLLLVSEPTAAVTLEDYVDAFDSGDDSERKVLKDWFIQLNAGDGFTPDVITDLFARNLVAAREVAKEKNVPVEKVYIDDELDNEATRRYTCPEEIIPLYKATIGNVTDQLIVAQMIKLSISTLEASSTKDSTAIQNLYLQIPEVAAVVAKEAELLRETYRQSAFYLIVKTWGVDILNTLPMSQLDVISPRMPYTKPLKNLLARYL